MSFSRPHFLGRDPSSARERLLPPASQAHLTWGEQRLALRTILLPTQPKSAPDVHSRFWFCSRN